MNDLELLRATPTPRPPEVCRRFRLHPIWGFVLYGLLWFFVSCVFASAGLFGAMALIGTEPSTAGKVIALGAWVGGFVLAWVLFAMWVRRRRAPEAELFRDGSFADARIDSVRRLWLRGVQMTQATLRLDTAGGSRTLRLAVGGHPAALREGLVVPVLWVPGHSYCAAFPLGSKLVPASLSSSS